MKEINEVIAYDRARHVIDNFEFPELEPSEKLVIKFRSCFGDKIVYTLRGKPRTMMAAVTIHDKASFLVMNSNEEVREHMLEMLSECTAFIITATRTRVDVSTPMTSRDIIRTLNKETDGYTELHIVATYDDAISKVIVVPEDNKYSFSFSTFSMGLDADAPAIVETYKSVKNHKCAIKHINDIFRLTLPFEDSFLTIERKEKSTIFEYLCPGPAYIPRPFHEELLVVAWQPDLMKNCIDEHDSLFARW